MLLLIGFMAMVMKPIGPYAEYILNKEFIANNYCVNQDRPQLKCNGMCYLMTRLKAQAESTSDEDVFQIVISPDFPVFPPNNFSWLSIQDDATDWPIFRYDWRDKWSPQPPGPPPRLILA